MPQIDASERIPFVSSLAREAGQILLSHFGRVGYELKGEADLVTVADRASEKLIAARLRAQYPGEELLGEEGTRENTGASRCRWHIDPLDGTTNFAHGYPVFCVSIGLEIDGELALGVLYDPTRDELYAGAKGCGATLNGRPMHVSRTAKLRDSLLATGFPSPKRHQNPNVHFYHEITLRSHGIRRAGSAALDLAGVASGRYDGYWEFNLHSWDTAAGVLLVREAGGLVTRFDNSPFRIDSREMMASNGLIHGEMLQVFDDLFHGRNLEPIPSPVEYAAKRDQ